MDHPDALRDPRHGDVDSPAPGRAIATVNHRDLIRRVRGAQRGSRRLERRMVASGRRDDPPGRRHQSPAAGRRVIPSRWRICGSGASSVGGAGTDRGLVASSRGPVAAFRAAEVEMTARA
jgi:hypothetical protein